MSLKDKLQQSNLYFVTSRQYSGNRPTFDIATQAVRAGIDMLQLREKDMAYTDFVALAYNLAALCKANNVTYIINDDPEIAKQVKADGVHLGQEDIKTYPIPETRKLLGNDRIIGFSTHSVEQVQEANTFDLDYIAFGPIFTTKTKNYTIGTSDVQTALKISKHPVVFIGGINPSNIKILLDKGVKNIAVIRAISQALDIDAAVQELKSVMESCIIRNN